MQNFLFKLTFFNWNLSRKVTFGFLQQKQRI